MNEEIVLDNNELLEKKLQDIIEKLNHIEKKIEDEYRSKKEEVLVFVDSGYLTAITKYYLKSKGIKIDLESLFENICEELDLELVNILYFTAKPDGKTISPQFITKIESFPKMKVYKKGYMKYPGTSTDPSVRPIEKGVDVQLTLEMTKYAIKSEIKNFLLIAGDADFLPVVDMVQKEGKKVILVYSIINASDPSLSVTTNTEYFKCVNKRFELTEEFMENNILDK